MSLEIRVLPGLEVKPHHSLNDHEHLKQSSVRDKALCHRMIKCSVTVACLWIAVCLRFKDE